MLEIWIRSLGWEEPLETKMAAHSSVLAWRIPCTEEPGGLLLKELDMTEQPSVCTQTHTRRLGNFLTVIHIVINTLELKPEYLDFKSKILSVTFCF